MSARLQLRGDTLANWLKYDPVLMEREIALIASNPAKPKVYDLKKVGDGTSKFSELPMLGYECLQDAGDSQQFPMSQKATTEIVRGIKDGMTASEYPTIRIPDFAVGVTETGDDKNAKVLEKFNTWLNGVDFSLSGKHIGHCIVGVDGRNGDVYNYIFSHRNKYGVQVLMGGFDIKADGTICNGESYNILYRVCNNGTTGEWIDYVSEKMKKFLANSAT